jgi:hypothetical protein
VKITQADGGGFEVSRGDARDLYLTAANVAERVVSEYWWHHDLARLTYFPRVFLVRLIYRIRNNFFDGFFPVALGVAAILAMYGVIDVRWLQQLVPFA